MLAPLSIEKLRNRFFQEGRPYWWAYNASKQAETVGSFRDDDPSLDKDGLIEYSWMQLEELFDADYGYIKVICKKNANDNKTSAPTYYVKWGDPSSRFSSNKVPTDIGSTGGGSWGMMQMMMNMQQEHHKAIIDLQSQVLEQDYEKRIMENEIAGTQAPSIQETALMEGIGLLKSWLAPQVAPQQMQYQQTAALGTAGQKPKGERSQARPVSLDEIMKDLNAIKASIPGYHLNDMTRALAVFCQTQPEAAANYLGMLIQQVQNASHGEPG